MKKNFCGDLSHHVECSDYKFEQYTGRDNELPWQRSSLVINDLSFTKVTVGLIDNS